MLLLLLLLLLLCCHQGQSRGAAGLEKQMNVTLCAQSALVGNEVRLLTEASTFEQQGAHPVQLR
jgi:hypothetical protein